MVLLLDQVLIEQLVSEGLDHIILWGTDQPESTAWNFRRGDTLWVAELMAGKIQQTWAHVAAEVWNPIVAANRIQDIRAEVEGFIFPYVLDRVQPELDKPFELLIENKGCAPAVAGTLEICAAALTRQCSVVYVTPVEPQDLYIQQAMGRSAQVATESQQLSLGEYFWPLERERIRSAWQQGNFAEARVWLTAHQANHAVLYRLAEILSIASNGQLVEALKRLRGGWLASKSLTASIEQIQQWQQKVSNLIPAHNTSESETLQAWETMLLIELALKRESYTAAFMQFAQLLERLLAIQARANQWVKRGYVMPPESFRGARESFNPGLGGLIIGWGKANRVQELNAHYQLLDKIRELRNDAVHEGRAVTQTDFQSRLKWKQDEIMRAMQIVLQQVSVKQVIVPEQLLLKSLHQWGLTQLSQLN